MKSVERPCGSWHAPGVDYRWAPWALTWDEADPGRHRFDAAAARDVICGVAAVLPVPVRPAGGAGERYVIEWAHSAGDAWVDSMAAVLVERFGPWSAGWRWAMDEGDFGGGPVGSWCCARDSMTSAEETLDRVERALVEWRGWLEDLAERFDRYPLYTVPESERRLNWERGAVHLVHHVVDRTGAGDAWYRHCAQVLTWFLARWGIEKDRAGQLVDQAIGGRFDSWVGPADSVVHEVAGKLAGGAVDAHHG